jgi:ADP-ribose pyrophosphatase
MGNSESLLNDYLLHKKSRTQKHASYPARFPVPGDKVKWNQIFAGYHPVEYNAPIVLDANTPWADPQDITKITHPLISFEGTVKLNVKGLPINPFGRTGLTGRGVIGKWGANFAVDAIITTLHPETHLFRVLTITRRDTGETAFPGGMVDPGENVMQARNRELNEEISLCITDIENPLYEKIVLEGYVDDPRNTDNAWMETTAIHTHIDYSIAQNMILSAGDDAVGFKWLDVTAEAIGNFYANHGLSLLRALNELVKDNNRSFIDNNARKLFQEIV